MKSKMDMFCCTRQLGDGGKVFNLVLNFLTTHCYHCNAKYQCFSKALSIECQKGQLFIFQSFWSLETIVFNGCPQLVWQYNGNFPFLKYNTYRQNCEFLVCPWKESWARPKYNGRARDCSHGQCLLCVFCAHGNSHAHAHAYSHGHARDYVHGHVHYWQTCAQATSLVAATPVCRSTGALPVVTLRTFFPAATGKVWAWNPHGTNLNDRLDVRPYEHLGRTIQPSFHFWLKKVLLTPSKTSPLTDVALDLFLI